MPTYHRPDLPALAPGPGPSLADHAQAWRPAGPDPGYVVDTFLNEARAAYRIRRDDDTVRPLGEVAAESERPGVLPVAPAAPLPDSRPNALTALCQALGVEFLALAEARRDGANWDAGHWRRLRGAVEAAGIALDAGPRAEGRT